MRLNTEYKRIPGHSRKQIHKARVKNTTPVQSLNNFDEVDVTSRQLEGMDDVNKRVATSPQRQQCNLMRVGNKGDCFAFDLFKNRISQSEKKISKKDEVISFLTQQLSRKNINAFTIFSNSLHTQSQERKSVNKNPPNDSIESDIPWEELHTVK